MLKASGFFDLTRIRYIIFLNIPLLLSAFILAKNFDLRLILFICISYFFAHFFVNAINDLYDVEEDRINRIKSVENPICSGKISRKEGRYITITLPFFAILFAIPTNLIWLGAIIFTIFLGWSYSAPPIRAEMKPWGFLVNESLGSSVGFVWTYLAVKPTNLSLPFWVFPIALFIFFSHAIIISKDLPDMKSDREYGFRTFALVYGVRTTQRFIILSIILSLIIYLYLLVIGIFSIISLPFAIIGAILPLKNISKPLNQLTDRHLIYQKVIPGSLFYSISLILGLAGKLVIPF
ncbi:MAG: UbiA family prenyltransferase [Candidatus Bathyarchaeota archaeon]|nr:UbiA family prenyltransferase [Candidatus Bathyarchaeota archaeon]